MKSELLVANQEEDLEMTVYSSMKMSAHHVKAVKKANSIPAILRNGIKNKTAAFIMPDTNLLCNHIWSSSGHHILTIILKNYKIG